MVHPTLSQRLPFGSETGQSQSYDKAGCQCTRKYNSPWQTDVPGRTSLGGHRNTRWVSNAVPPLPTVLLPWFRLSAANSNPKTLNAKFQKQTICNFKLRVVVSSAMPSSSAPSSPAVWGSHVAYASPVSPLAALLGYQTFSGRETTCTKLLLQNIVIIVLFYY